MSESPILRVVWCIGKSSKPEPARQQDTTPVVVVEKFKSHINVTRRGITLGLCMFGYFDNNRKSHGAIVYYIMQYETLSQNVGLAYQGSSSIEQCRELAGLKVFPVSVNVRPNCLFNL